jgi:hypothetical protein
MSAASWPLRLLLCGDSAASAQIRETTPSVKVRLSCLTVVPARFDAIVEVPPAANGLYQILHHTKASAPAVSQASVIAEIQANVPFRDFVINPTCRAHTICKGMVICLGVSAPTRVLSLESRGEKLFDPLAEDSSQMEAFRLDRDTQAVESGCVTLLTVTCIVN